VVDSSAWLEYLAGSLIYATALRHAATLWTQDAHFEGLPGVRYFARPARRA
jgi:predicted nucleic acid-binding protein